MSIKKELLKGYIIDCINNYVSDFDFNCDDISDSKAICILSEIWQIIKNNDLSDFEKIEEIMCVFEKNNISTGACHDFI